MTHILEDSNHKIEGQLPQKRGQLGSRYIICVLNPLILVDSRKDSSPLALFRGTRNLSLHAARRGIAPCRATTLARKCGAVETPGTSIEGQLSVPRTVYPWYLLCSLGILGDYNL